MRKTTKRGKLVLLSKEGDDFDIWTLDEKLLLASLHTKRSSSFSL